ncbi:transmembrane protein, putative (macronuclear) [Tetrahymena thermophila SB210]|uniref:Transmembrane protein, putative n=1 Tax=Tetrahymena thermophila (strain SB210) TaxID=312017 RepID=I7M2I0_TETTS|nr:transmembrane protein, putative [Tetrahymena thermophila SB210]EAS00427.1 transmembrane protein, putative [Tetrahymena thermophila SB210]|eukprot:XP_001020672.1 transmembrane protein, putative [Tetrahymena thermophila SB210]
MKDQFRQEYDQIKKLQLSITRDITKREQMKIQGKSLGSIDSEIRGQLKSFESDILKITQLVQDQERNLQNLGLTAREIEQRRSMIVELEKQKKQQLDTLIQQDKMASKNQKMQKPANFQEKYDIEGQTNKQIYKYQQQELDSQDKQIQVMLSTVNKIKTGGQNIVEEVDDQVQLLNDLDIGLDKNTQLLNKNSGKLKNLLKTNSNFCLLTCVCLEIFLLMFFLIFL